MLYLFVHQNFPGQFKFLSQTLASNKSNKVVALCMKQQVPKVLQGVEIRSYRANRGSTQGVHPWVSDFETKTIRAEACFMAALQLKAEGFTPDVIVAHPGWGESMLLKEVWPHTRLGIYCEFYYHPEGADVGFDPEFGSKYGERDRCRLRLKNLNNVVHFQIADAGISPTQWQASTFPEPFRSRITVAHDGIDTTLLSPNPAASLTLNNSLTLTCKDEVITFINRNLEPYRGYHVFMRALPKLLKQRPNARVFIVGGDKVSYGAKPEGEESWKERFIAEVRPGISDTDWARVHFLGRIPYNILIHLLQLSTVHVYLTYPFVLSWSLLEAMSIGCAIVASNTKPLLEAIHHNETGRLVDFFDETALTENICELLDNHDERARLGANARRFAQATYDLSTICLPRQLAWVRSLG